MKKKGGGEKGGKEERGEKRESRGGTKGWKRRG